MLAFLTVGPKREEILERNPGLNDEEVASTSGPAEELVPKPLRSQDAPDIIPLDYRTIEDPKDPMATWSLG